MYIIWESVAQGWDNVLARTDGHFKLRFVLQPTMAALIARRAGLRDARQGRPAFLWAAVSGAAVRTQLLHGGWQDIRTLFLVAATLDAVYQLITIQNIYPVELLFTATLLALLPYVLLRGPLICLARRWVRSTGAHPSDEQRP